jgi:hypothetical protein
LRSLQNSPHLIPLPLEGGEESSNVSSFSSLTLCDPVSKTAAVSYQVALNRWHSPYSLCRRRLKPAATEDMDIISIGSWEDISPLSSLGERARVRGKAGNPKRPGVLK